MSQDQGDHWRGMGHSQVTHGTGSGGEPDEQEGERSSSASSSGGAGFDYKIEPDGEVIPIGGEEEEEEEEEEGEEEGGGGPEFPPLPKNLNEIFTVHKNLLFENDPDLSETEWEIPYEKPVDRDYLTIIYAQHDRVINSTPGDLTVTLNGKEPDNVSRDKNGSGSNTTQKSIGVMTWNEPESGPLVLKLTGTGGQTYLAVLPISTKGGINVPSSTAHTEDLTNPYESGTFLMALPSAYIWGWRGARSSNPAPVFSKFWTGYKIFGWKSESPLGTAPGGTFEVALGVGPTGEHPYELLWEFPNRLTISAFARAVMNL